MKKIAILGSTGSIGRNALKLVDLYPDRLQVVALAAQNRADLLYEQCLKYRPAVAALHDVEAARSLPSLPHTRILSGAEGVAEVACQPGADLVLAAISGGAGLLPTYHAVAAGKDVALANKETLVMAGRLIMELARRNQSRLLPVDSEHSALHQCLRGTSRSEVARLILTASGGPFLHKDRHQLQQVTVREALEHPTWQMGPKITIDSATLMNKGLEVIEAHHLFGMGPEQISVVIHPQSVVHSLVEFVDGTLLAQMSITDMRSALLYAFAYPARWESKLPALNLVSASPLAFHPPDPDRFPCLELAYQALRQGGTAPVVLNASNEVAVEAFLQEQIPFSAIPEIISSVLASYRPTAGETLEEIRECDREARQRARGEVSRIQAARI